MNDMIDQLLSFLPSWAQSRYLQSSVVVVLSLAAAKIADFLICHVALRFTKHTKTDFDDKVVAILHRPLFVSVLLIGLEMALLRLGLPRKIESVSGSGLQTIAVVVWLVFAMQAIGLFLDTLSRRRKAVVQSRTLPLFKNLAFIVFIGVAVYFVLVSWNIDVTAWLASAGIIGIALGFAAKDTLANLFAGVFILVDAPYKMGDFVILDSGERGQVTHIGIRSTRLLTRDDIEITIPNAIMGNSKIINETGGPHQKERVRLKVGVAYGSDVDKVREVLMKVAEENADVCRHPEPRVRFRSFGNSSLDFELLGWVDEPVLRGRILDRLNTEVYKAFARENIEIPYPKHDVYIKESPGKEGE
jgi:small-conductance mechanosensitive channel